MKQEIADIVYPVLEAGLLLKERLAREPRGLDITKEQADLRSKLLTKEAARRWTAYGGDSDEQFLGIRYALVCWLDEIFIIDSPWSREWESQSLEESQYRRRDRAFLFDRQARMAAADPEGSALEGYYLCVMLGFRGDYREFPERLREFRSDTEKQLKIGQLRDWPDRPPELTPETNVPPLVARERLRGIVLIFAMLFGLVVPLAAFLITFVLTNTK